MAKVRGFIASPTWEESKDALEASVRDLVNATAGARTIAYKQISVRGSLSRIYVDVDATSPPFGLIILRAWQKTNPTTSAHVDSVPSNWDINSAGQLGLLLPSLTVGTDYLLNLMIIY